MHHVAIAAALKGALRLFLFFFQFCKRKTLLLHTDTPPSVQTASRRGWIREQSALFSLSVESREEAGGSAAELNPSNGLQGIRILPRVVTPPSHP